MKRNVRPELLDVLPPDDPRARRSRRDLRRVNACMRNPSILAGALRTAASEWIPARIAELGAGDGQFLLRVARILAPNWPGLKVVLVDRLTAVEPATVAQFRELGWSAEPVLADALDWIADSNAPLEVVVANLFLHHLTGTQLAELFSAVATRARLFVAVEPRRGAWPLLCSRLIWMIGCKAVTSYDATVSVRAGFAASELSSFWPRSGDWRLSEMRAGPFSHLFIARRRS